MSSPVWAQETFPFEPATGATSPGQQNGSLANVLCDGSTSYNITFPAAFISVIPTILPVVTNVSNAGQIVGTPQISNLSLTGFTVYIAGAITGTTCTFEWQTQNGV